MNRKHLAFSAIILFVLLSWGGCQKETITDPNDPLIVYFNGLLDPHPDYLFKRFTEILFD